MIVESGGWSVLRQANATHQALASASEASRLHAMVGPLDF